MPKLPDSIFATVNDALAEKGKLDMRWRQIFSVMVLEDNKPIKLHFDITEYTRGKLRKQVERINHAVIIADWVRTPSAKKVNKKYARQLCIKKDRKPALVGVVRDPAGNLHDLVIDGNHRLMRAFQLSMRTYPAHRLTESETKAIMMTDKELHTKYDTPKGRESK